MDNRSLDELVDEYIDQEEMYRVEGRTGVKNLCKLVRAIGYKDPMYFGQLSSDAAIGDLICFFEDNSGAIEAVIEWIKGVNSPEFAEKLKEVVHPPEDEGDQETDE